MTRTVFWLLEYPDVWTWSGRSVGERLPKNCLCSFHEFTEHALGKGCETHTTLREHPDEILSGAAKDLLSGAGLKVGNPKSEGG